MRITWDRHILYMYILRGLPRCEARRCEALRGSCTCAEHTQALWGTRYRGRGCHENHVIPAGISKSPRVWNANKNQRGRLCRGDGGFATPPSSHVMCEGTRLSQDTQAAAPAPTQHVQHTEAFHFSKHAPHASCPCTVSVERLMRLLAVSCAPRPPHAPRGRLYRFTRPRHLPLSCRRRANQGSDWQKPTHPKSRSRAPVA